TPSRRREPGSGAHWRLISHLALNHLSLAPDAHGHANPDDVKRALQGILELYDVPGESSIAQQIPGIPRAKSTRVVRLGARACARGSTHDEDGGPSRGIHVEIELGRESFSGTGVYLFSSILERFLSLYASINSFTELVVRVDDDTAFRWPPRAGEQILL